METRSSVILLPIPQSFLLFGMPDVSPMTRQVTLRKEKPSCSRESQHRLAVPAGVIIPGQKSILLTACPSTISINTPQAATGTPVSASSTLSAEHPRQRRPRRPLPRQALRPLRRLDLRLRHEYFRHRGLVQH